MGPVLIEEAPAVTDPYSRAMRRSTVTGAVAAVAVVGLVLVALARSSDVEGSDAAATSMTSATTTSVVEIDPVVIAPPTPGEGFPDGTWSGVIAQDQSFLTIPGGAVATTSDFFGTFVITVEDGFVTGTYVITANQVIESPEGNAEGSAVLTGLMEGSSAGPALVAQLFGFDGTATIDGEVRPFQFEQPLPAVAAPADWTFETVTSSYVAGRFSSEELVAATEAASGVSFSTSTSVFAAVPGEETDIDLLIALLRESAGIGG